MTRLLILFALLCATPSVAAARWHQATTRHFVITSEHKPDELRRYAERLERFDHAVRQVREMSDPPLSPQSKLSLYVLRDARAVQRLSGIPYAHGFYLGRASGAFAFAHRDASDGPLGLKPEHVFFHEYLHHLMMSDLKVSFPAWMVEGYAEFFGTAIIKDDGRVQFGAPPLNRGPGLFRRAGLSLEELVGVERPKDHADRDSLYGLGWLLSHYLTFEPSRRGQASRYVQAMQQGAAPAEAARQAFGDLKALDRELQRYLTRPTFRLHEVPPREVGAIDIRALTPAEEAILEVQMRSARGVNARTAGEVAAEARKVAAAYPADAVVLGALAEAEYDARNYDAALGAAERALAVDPRSTQALIYKGRALFEKAERNPDAKWAEVRRWFVRANRIDTEDAEPLFLFYRTYHAEGVKPPKDAVEGLLYALALAPQDRSLRHAAVNQMIADSRFPDAARLFAPLAYDPHLPADRREAFARAMERLRANDATGAVSALRGQPDTAKP